MISEITSKTNLSSFRITTKLLLIHRSAATIVLFVIVTLLIICQQQTVAEFQTQSPASVNRGDSSHCNWWYCDTVVNKCWLTNRCFCVTYKKDAKCAKECIDCLEEKFGRCCACVNLCPVFGNGTQTSHVGYTAPADGEDYPLLFESMTESDDIFGRWRVMKINAGLYMTHPKMGQVEYAFRKAVGSNSNEISHDPELDKLECQVAFINRYLSLTRCKKTCTHMGAHYFRWFHDGCCECVGRYCLNFGLAEPKCIIVDEDL